MSPSTRPPAFVIHLTSTMATQESSTSRPRKASRVLSSVKRSLTPANAKRRPSDTVQRGMHSTATESSATSGQHFREPTQAASRPSVEQIAMGLHVSRTPHLRPHVAPYVYEQTRSPTLPPPPSRSSLKKSPKSMTSSSSTPVLSPPSTSSTTITSVTPASPQSQKPFGGLRFRMARFLPHHRSTSLPTSLGTPPRSSSSEFSPVKAVRFKDDDA